MDGDSALDRRQLTGIAAGLSPAFLIINADISFLDVTTKARRQPA